MDAATKVPEPESIQRALRASAAFSQMWPRLAVFPLRPMVRTDDGLACDCRKGTTCKSLGKHPDGSDGRLWSTLKPGEKWKSRHADGVGYGIATGARSGGLWVVDLDGWDAVEAFFAMGPVPDTFAVGRGPERVHLYFEDCGFPVRNSAKELIPGIGIDVRGEGGYVVAPGSPHKSGETYEVTFDVPPAPAPEWLVKWRGLRQGKPRAAKRPGLVKATGRAVNAVNAEDALEASVPRAWRIERAKAWLATRPAAVEGEGGDRHTWLTVLVAVKRFWLANLAMAHEALEDWNERCEPPWEGPEWERTIERAIASEAVPWNLGLDLEYAWSEREVRVGGAA